MRFPSSLSLLFLALLVVGVLVVGVVGLAGSGVSEAQAQVAREEQKTSIQITGYQLTPEVLMPNDLGTVTVTVKNAELAKSVNIKEARLLSKELKVASDSYFNIGRLGHGESLDLTFTLKATACPDGIYYPRVLVKGEDAQNIRYSFPVRVDSTLLTLAVKDVPEDIFKGERARIELAVGNPRPNTATGVKITAVAERREEAEEEEKGGEGVAGGEELVPSEVFVGALSRDETKTASFNFTPQTNGTRLLNFKLEFKNGENLHSAELSLPLKVTESKKKPELVLTGIEVEPSASGSGIYNYKITGDINNAGLEDANGVVMKIGDAEGVEATHPYKSYFVGLLSPDDFSSFELDVKVSEDRENEGEGTKVPLRIEYKDEDGFLFSKTEYIAIERQQGQRTGSSGVGVGELPLSVVVVLLFVVAVVVGLIAYSWKKR